MSYFPHSYKKVFVGSQSYGTWMLTGGGTLDLAESNAFGFYDPRTWQAIAPADADVADYPEVVFVMGSSVSDRVGPYGGYGESIKSQPIRPDLVHRFWWVQGSAPTGQVVYVGWDGTNATTAPSFECGRNYSLRVDLKGAPADRLLGHNFYSRFDVLTDCCDDSEDPQFVDPIEVLLAFAKQMNADPIFSQFVTADVITTDSGDVGSAPDVVNPDTYTPLTDAEDIAAAIGALRLTVTYSASAFTCSVDRNDFVGSDPVYISSAQLVDGSGDVCPDFKQLNFTEHVAAWGGMGTSGQIFHDLILSDNYRQEFFNPDVRRRQIEGSNAMNIPEFLDSVTVWDSYYILHSVPRRYNPSGVYDNDRYVIQLSVPSGTDMTDFLTWMENYLDSAGEGVVLEDMT